MLQIDSETALGLGGLVTVMKSMKVSTLETDSWVATLVRSLSVIPIVAAFAGTKLSWLADAT